MPRIIRTPEDILRKTRQDLYFVRFTDGFAANLDDRPVDGQAEFQAWFKTHQPHVVLEAIAPSEFSGFISSRSIGEIALLNWSDADIKAFAEAWETEDGGSLDPRWQVFLYRQEDLRQRESLSHAPLHHTESISGSEDS